MSFHIDPAIPLPRAVRSAALDELRGALRRLRRGTVRDVHEVRKSTKKLRAWARLMRPVLGRDYVVLNLLLRDAARALAGNRDRTVARATLTSLKPDLGPEDRAQVLAEVLVHLPAGTRRQRNNGRRVAESLLRVARHYLQRTALSQAQPKRWHKRLGRTFRQCHGAYVVSRRRATAARLHEWRKLTKYQIYQRGLLAPLFPDAGKRVGTLRRLSDVLGRHHDLAMLAQLIRRQQSEAGARARRAIRERQLALEQGALVLGSKLFDP